MESAVRLIPAVTLALLKEEGADDEDEESSAWETLHSRYPFRPRLNVRRSSRPFSVGEEESSEETTRFSSFDRVEADPIAEPPSIWESRDPRGVRIEQRDLISLEIWFAREDERESWVEFEAKFATLSKGNNSEKETKDEQEDTTGGICLFFSSFTSLTF